ncbi:MAG: sporulation integral membrane protein YtvI [Tissierellia bacterium]|nr:sporulation integral membrane protein YtvI [Tissierellia bacterium]
MQNYNGKIYLKILTNLIIYAVAILCLVLIVPKVLRFFLPFIIGWIIAVIANPLVKFLEKRVKILRKYSSALIIVLVIGIIILALYGITSFVSEQISALINDVPNIATLITDTMNQVGENLSGIFEILPKDLQLSLVLFVENIKESINAVIVSERVSEFTISFARNFMDYILMVFIVFISAYFFIKDREYIVGKARNATPDYILEKYDLIIYYFKYATGGYFKAQFKIMFIIIIIMFLGFKMIGVKYSLLIAFITGLIDVLPVFGTGFILWPWALVELILGNYFNAIFLIGIYLLCQIVKNALQPKMVGDSVGIDPLTTLLFLYIGYKFGGVVGMIISIPIGLIITNLYRAGMFDNIIRGLKILINDINQYRKF